jgi:Tfp pilus assembly protein PilF
MGCLQQTYRWSICRRQLPVWIRTAKARFANMNTSVFLERVKASIQRLPEQIRAGGALALPRMSSILPLMLAFSVATAPTVFQQAVAATPMQSAATAKLANSIGDKWAVVIGCSKFADSRVPVLKYSAKDAQDFADFLTDPTFGKFKKDHVKLLTNEEATKVNIMDTIGDSFLPHAAMPGDLVVIYLSTHGSPAGADIRGVNYVVAFDTRVDKLYATGIEMKQLLRVIKERVHTDRILLVMDTCYSGAGADEGHKGITRTNIDAAEVAQGCGSLVISSSSPSQRAWESDRLQNSFFTRYLIDSMKESGGQVTIDQAFDKMKNRVQEGVLKEKGEMQTPIMSGVFKGPKLVLSVTPTAPHESPFSVIDTASPTKTGSEIVNLGDYAQHMHEAKGLESKHKFWEAAHELELSMKDNPSSVEAYLAAAQVYDSQGRYDKSLEAAKRAVMNDDNSSSAHEQLGLAYFRNNYGTEALRQAQLAVTKDPQNSMAHNLLAFINEHNNHNDLAEQEYREALSLNAVNVRALVNLGLLLQKQNRDSQQAEDCFRKAINADADDWQAHMALAKLLYRKKDFAAAEEEIKKAVASEPSNPDLHCEYANLLAFSKDHYDQAEAEFRKAIELASNNASAHQAFADFLLTKRNRADEAEKEYKLAITSDANTVGARVGLGNLLLARKSYDEADVLFKKALALDARDAGAHVGLATINAELYHNYTGAQDELKKALTLNDKLAIAHEKMGEILYRNMNRPSDGKIELEQAIAIDPNLAEAHFQLGMLLAEAFKAKADDALAELQKAVTLEPNSSRYETKLGWWQSQNFHEFKDAEKHYRRAIEINNSYSEAHLKLGMLMVEKFGMRKSGDEELRIAYQQDPNDPEIKAAFARFVGK